MNKYKNIFTFHNVSINTGSQRLVVKLTKEFTFHNVSINTDMSLLSVQLLYSYLHSTMFLLIRVTTLNCRLSRRTHLHSTMFLLIPILHNPLYYKPNSTIFCQPCHLLYLSNTIFNNIMKIFLFLQ